MENQKMNCKNRFSTNTKRQAVLDLESGDFTIGEIQKKYEIGFSATLKSWGRKYSKTPEKYFPNNKKTSKATRIMAVKEILSGFLSLEEATKKYNISSYTIGAWVRQLSKEINNSNSAADQIESINVQVPMTQEEQSTLKGLEIALKAEKLRTLGLEIMIELAEKNYNLDIRKKFGSKQ